MNDDFRTNTLANNSADLFVHNEHVYSTGSMCVYARVFVCVFIWKNGKRVLPETAERNASVSAFALPTPVVPQYAMTSL